jgi:hypothetical protein
MTVRLTSSTLKYKDNAGELNFEGDLPEIEMIQKALQNGSSWVRMDEAGNIIAAPAYKKPELSVDTSIEPHFQKKAKLHRLTKKQLIPEEECAFPDFFVQSISGYDGHYEEKAAKMEEAGFECLRSRRNKDGKYWEIWYLPSLSSFEGKKDAKKQDVIRFLASLGVGQFNISTEHWGASLD